jgi:guanylate kinase
MSEKINNSQQGQLFTIAAPSGVGKTSLVQALLDSVDNVHISISYTTRPAREGEVDGVSYRFVDEAKFKEMIARDDFLEYAKVFDHYKGTSNSWVGRQLEKGKNVILEIDWQGVQQIKRLFPSCQRIFILPPSMEVLQQRLRGRGKDSEEIIQGRLAAAGDEMSHWHESEFQLVNDDFDKTLSELQTLVITSRHSVEHNTQTVRDVAAELSILSASN